MHSMDFSDTQLIDAINDFAAAWNEGTEIDAIFLDLSKAFDTVPHILCYKLAYCGIRNNTKDFLTAKHRVSLNGHTSDICHVLSGMPQESGLEPLLFLCCMILNDVMSNLKFMLMMLCFTEQYIRTLMLTLFNKIFTPWFVGP